MSRRDFLLRAAGAGGGLMLAASAGCAPAISRSATDVALVGGGLPPGKDEQALILHSPGPLVLETRRSAFSTGGITPYERLFVRNNLPTPPETFVADRERWELTVEGVGSPRSVRLGDLKGLGRHSIATVLQCSGNGRGFFEHGPNGSPWAVGAAGCVIWTGVPVRLVAESMGGVVSSARFATGTGGELFSEGVDVKSVMVERSIPLAKAMEDALLAWEMNGAPLPLAHGGPLRLIVPGYYGVNNVKYLRRLAFTEAESDAAIMRTSYRMRPIGQPGSPEWPSQWEMNVKSWINHPAGDAPVQSGRVMIEGVAFAGDQPVRSVEVSIDGGRSWRPAPFVGLDLGPFAWRNFALPVELPAGSHTLLSRATDYSGKTQPEQRQENDRGYSNNSWRDHAVTLAVL